MSLREELSKVTPEQMEGAIDAQFRQPKDDAKPFSEMLMVYPGLVNASQVLSERLRATGMDEATVHAYATGCMMGMMALANYAELAELNQQTDGPVTAE